MHKFTQAALATAVFCLSSYPALSEGIDTSLHQKGFTALAGINASPLTPLDMSRTRGAFGIIVNNDVKTASIP